MTDDQATGGASATDCWPDLSPPPATDDQVTPPAQWQRVGRGPKRRTRWDRPPHPKDWRFFVGWMGRSLIILGLLMFLFVAYQLWGTGIETARAQNRLEDEFAQLLEANPLDPAPTIPVTSPVTTAAPATTVATPTTIPSAVPGTPTTAPAATTIPPPTTIPAVVPAEEQNLPVFERGDALAQLVIPRIGVSDIVVSGVTRNDLKQGPGHFRDTPLPGQLGNSAIAGHRTTSGAPFGNLDQLAAGDEIQVTMPNRHQYVYIVTGSEVVTPDDYRVISASDPTEATLTLVTCTPKWSSTHRLIVYAELDLARSGPIGEPIITGQPEAPELDVPVETTPATAPVTAPATAPSSGSAAPTSEPGAPVETTPPPTTTAPPVDGEDDQAAAAPAESDAFSEGWFADNGAWAQIALWGLALVAFTTAGWWLARFWRREWVGALAAFVPFFVCLYFFFQNVNRLLPPGL